MSDYDEFEAWSTPKSRKSRKNRKKDAKRVNVYPRLAGGIDEIPQMLGKEPLAAEDRPEEERMTRERAEALAGEILGWLEPVTDYAEVAGSYRRGRQDPGDLDVIVILKNRVKLPEIAELWLAEGKASAVNWVGEKKTQLLIDGVKVDIRTSTPRALGAALLYFTGPAGYNIGIRSAAKRAGFKLSEYGLFNRETGEYIAGATEEDIYTAMGRNYRPPTERRAEENVSFATEENNEMQEAIIRGLRNLARDGYVVAAPPYGNRSRNFYQYLSTEIMSELAELGSDDEGPEVTGSGRAIDPYNVVRSLARNQSFSMPDNDNNELSVGIADMVMSFTQQSTMMDEQDGFIPPEGYTEMVFDLPGDGLITRRLAWKVAFAMGIYPTANNRLFLYSTPQKNRNCSMIVNMLLEELSEEVAGMSVSEQEQFYQEFGDELKRQVEYHDGPLQEEYERNKEWKIRNYGANNQVDRVTVREDIKDRAVTAAQRLNPFSAESFGAETYTPPASAVKAAKRGLEQRKKYGRGGLSPAEAKSQGIDSGVTRARKIASGKVSKHDVRRMSAFNRHRKNNRPGKKMPDGGPTAGTIAWNLWGGSAGVNWAKKKSAAMNAETFESEYDDEADWKGMKFIERFPMTRRNRKWSGWEYDETNGQWERDKIYIDGSNGFYWTPIIDDDGTMTEERAIAFLNSKGIPFENLRVEYDGAYFYHPQSECYKHDWGTPITIEGEGNRCGDVIQKCNFPLCSETKFLEPRMHEWGDFYIKDYDYGNGEFYSTQMSQECENCGKERSGHGGGKVMWDFEAEDNPSSEEPSDLHWQTQDFADRFEIQIRTSRGNLTERIPVSAEMLVPRVREILARKGYLYAIDIFTTRPEFMVSFPDGRRTIYPKPELMATHKYERFETGKMANHLNEKLGLI